MSFVVIVGYSGKMSKIVHEVLSTKKIPHKFWSEKAPGTDRVNDFAAAAGVIDFSLPEVTNKVLPLVERAKVPYVCGTTGFASNDSARKEFERVAREAPIVWDSNFSLGVELLAKASELLARSISDTIQITDIHHIHKRDKPSGTALKLNERMLSANPKASIQIESQRVGEVFGEHHVRAIFDDQSVDWIHRAHSRKPFAEGALRALEWAKTQKPGLYSMKDIFV
jgi:4-hydroxy-tetrahydrodipicolinate reductase